MLYVLDEPSIGLHQRDNDRLLETLKRLRDLGNTVLVVEHDEETIRAADYVVDLGPGAGRHGGARRGAGHAGRRRVRARVDHGRLSARRARDRRAGDAARRAAASRSSCVGAREHNLKDVTSSFRSGASSA